MKLITYLNNNTECIGIISEAGDYVYPCSAAGVNYSSMNELIILAGENEMESLRKLSKMNKEEIDGCVLLSEVKLCAPIPVPLQDIICLGINYVEHAKESARYKKEAFEKDRTDAIYFSKRVNRAVADGESISAHRNLVERLDYEAELAVIIGKDATAVSYENVSEYIFGYTIINDVSARDVQTSHKQWYFGKSLDGFTPMGPCIVTSDDIAYPPKLGIRSYINGELRQNSNTELLITDIGQIISELSSGMTLKAGTIISTGTPAGVGMGFVPPRFLNEGDIVECEIDGIGRIKNVVGR